MQMNDLLRQGKADAGFSAFAHVKAVEDVGKIFLGDAVPVVLYAYRHLPPVCAAGQAQLMSSFFALLCAVGIVIRILLVLIILFPNYTAKTVKVKLKPARKCVKMSRKIKTERIKPWI